MNVIRLMLFCVVLLYYFTCVPVSVEPASSFPIRLSLEKMGNYEAEFSGEPIVAIIETPDSVMFSELKWRTGNGTHRTTDTTLLKKRKKFTALLNWNRYPSEVDSVDNMRYDTIFIGMGGNLCKSNSVRVKVTNLPVVIDSMKVGTVTFRQSTPVWTFSVHDSISLLPMRMFASDLDGKTLDMQVIGSTYGIEQSKTQPLQLVYNAPTGPFRDTLTFIVSDRSRGQTLQTLYLSRIFANTPPVIDSVSINTKIYRFVSGITKGTWPKIDTLQFTAFFHDRYDTLKAANWKSSRNIIKTDPLRPLTMMYICTTSVDTDSTVKKTGVLLDTVWLTIYDSWQDSAKSAIILQKGIPNRSPVIDTFYAGDTVVNDTGSVLPLIDGNGLTSIQFRVRATDPDSSPIYYSWNSTHGTLSNKKGSSVTYTTASALVSDTVSVTVTDNEYSVVKKVIVSITDLSPKFDSISINGIRYAGITTSLQHYASPGERLIITVYARDLDLKDTLKYIWKMSDMKRIVANAKNRIIVQLLSKTYNDTIKLKIQDGVYTNDYTLVIKVADPEPVIDSIRIGIKIFKVTVGMISDSVSYPDTVQMEIFAHDDQMDTLAYSLHAQVSEELVAIDTTRFNFILPDSTYTDTVKVMVTDSKGNKTLKNTVLYIKGMTK